MAAPRFCSSRSYGFFSVLLIVCNTTLFVFAQDSLRNSSRECAICHVRWVDAFDRGESEKEKDSLGAMERSAGSGDMCLSCHDGSVVDSRFKVWSTSHHGTDVIPSPAVRIPTDKFPLDPQGRMTCATCHTAHAVPNSSDIRTVVFLRQPNIDSSLCLACHPDHAQKNQFQHPLGRADNPVPQVILDAGGKTSQDGHMIFCQTCHAAHGTQNTGMLVLPPAQLCVSCHAEKTPETSPPAGAPVHHIGRTYPGFKPPQSLLNQKAAFGPGGELDCLSCHRLHDASGAKPLLIHKNEDGSLCLECHEKEKSVVYSLHDLRVSAPQVLNAKGQTPATSGVCGTCHRIHGWARDIQDSRMPHSSACIDCHTTDGPGSHNRPYIAAHPVGIPVPKDTTPPLPLDEATRDIGCLTCHDPHTPLSPELSRGVRPPVPSETVPNESPDPKQAPPISPSGSFLRHGGSQLCILCHDKIANSLTGPHDPNTFAPEVRQQLGMNASIGACRVCHTSHNAQGPHLWARPAAASEDGKSMDLCGACHDKGLVNTPQGTHHPAVAPPYQDIQDPYTPRTNGGHPQIDCISCHEPHGGSVPTAQLRRPVQDLCVECHADKQGVQNSIHDPAVSPWAKDLGVVSKGVCVDCHVIHGPESKSGIRQLLPGHDDAQHLCQACHQAGAPGKPVEAIHTGKVLASVPKEPFDKLPLSGEKHILCSTCHDIHQKTQDPKMLRAPRHDSTLCLACHEDARGLLNTPHDLRTSAPEKSNPHGETAAQSGPCGACHQMHLTATEKENTSGPDFGISRCGSCHSTNADAVAQAPQFADHPEVAMFNPRPDGQPWVMPTFDKSGQPSPAGAITCLTCHQPHIPAGDGSWIDPRFLRPGTNLRLCADCHGTEALWRYLYFHKKSRNPTTAYTENIP